MIDCSRFGCSSVRLCWVFSLLGTGWLIDWLFKCSDCYRSGFVFAGGWLIDRLFKCFVWFIVPGLGVPVFVFAGGWLIDRLFKCSVWFIVPVLGVPVFVCAGSSACWEQADWLIDCSSVLIGSMFFVLGVELVGRRLIFRLNVQVFWLVHCSRSGCSSVRLCWGLSLSGAGSVSSAASSSSSSSSPGSSSLRPLPGALGTYNSI